MKTEKPKLVECPKCGKAYYVKKEEIEVKTKCNYCENWVFLITKENSINKYDVRIVYKIPFLYQGIEAKNEEEARIIALDMAREEYENESCFDIEEEVKIKKVKK